MVLFLLLYKVVLTFKSADETLECYYSNESLLAVLSSGAVYYAQDAELVGSFPIVIFNSSCLAADRS